MHQALRRCERAGLLRSKRDPSGRRYELTAAGRARLRAAREGPEELDARVGETRVEPAVVAGIGELERVGPLATHALERGERVPGLGCSCPQAAQQPRDDLVLFGLWGRLSQLSAGRASL